MRNRWAGGELICDAMQTFYGRIRTAHLKNHAKKSLLKLIAEIAYNAGRDAKRHFARYDIIEKLPDWMALLSAAVAILAFFIPALQGKWVLDQSRWVNLRCP